MKNNILKRLISVALVAGLLCGIVPVSVDAAAIAGAPAALLGESTALFVGQSPLSGANYAMAQALSTASTNYTPSDFISVTTATAPKEEPIVVTARDVTPDIDYANTVVAQVSDYVNVRSGPSEEDEILGKLYDDCVGTLLAIEGEWVKIKSGTVEGYVKGEYVVIGDTELIDSVAHYRAKVKADALKLRSEMNTDCTVLYVAVNGEKADIVNVDNFEDGWVKVKKGDTEGYFAAEYVDLAYEFDHAESKAEEAARLEAEAKAREAATASLGVRVANYALQFVGNPYVWGGTSLTKGADCSGFILSVYRNFGVSLPHSSYADRSVGRPVKTSDMRAGDIVCYSGHVALCIGDGMIVHAASRRSGIKVSSAYYRDILCVRRIF